MKALTLILALIAVEATLAKDIHFDNSPGKFIMTSIKTKQSKKYVKFSGCSLWENKKEATCHDFAMIEQQAFKSMRSCFATQFNIEMADVALTSLIETETWLRTATYGGTSPKALAKYGEYKITEATKILVFYNQNIEKDKNVSISGGTYETYLEDFKKTLKDTWLACDVADESLKVDKLYYRYKLTSEQLKMTNYSIGEVPPEIPAELPPEL